MKYTFEERNNGLCLVAEFEKEHLHAFVYPMLINNRIPGILVPTYERRANGRDALVYNVQGRVPFTNYLAEYVDADKAVKTCGMLKELWNLLDAYMIPDRCCIWDRDCMYVNPADGDIGVLCVPVDDYVSAPLDRGKMVQELERIIGKQVIVKDDPFPQNGNTAILYGELRREVQRDMEEARKELEEVCSRTWDGDACDSETTVLDSSMWNPVSSMQENAGISGGRTFTVSDGSRTQKKTGRRRKPFSQRWKARKEEKYQRRLHRREGRTKKKAERRVDYRIPNAS